MQTAIHIVLLAALGFLTFQDFRYRAVSWVPLVLVFGLLATKGLMELGAPKLGMVWLINSLILVMQFALLMVYFLIRGYGFRDFWQQVMGVGDLIFLACVSIAFAPLNFIVFLLGGLAFSIIVYGLMQLLKLGKDRPVPFAGLLSVFMIGIVILGFTGGKMDCYDEQMIFKFFGH